MSPEQKSEHRNILIVLALSTLLSLGAMAAAALIGPAQPTPHAHEVQSAQFTSRAVHRTWDHSAHRTWDHSTYRTWRRDSQHRAWDRSAYRTWDPHPDPWMVCATDWVVSVAKRLSA